MNIKAIKTKIWAQHSLAFSIFWHFLKKALHTLTFSQHTYLFFLTSLSSFSSDSQPIVLLLLSSAVCSLSLPPLPSAFTATHTSPHPSSRRTIQRRANDCNYHICKLQRVERQVCTKQEIHVDAGGKTMSDIWIILWMHKPYVAKLGQQLFIACVVVWVSSPQCPMRSSVPHHAYTHPQYRINATGSFQLASAYGTNTGDICHTYMYLNPG